MLKEGDTALDFELLDHKGNKIKLSDFKGKKILLYFYPKDNTPGCTKEACDFRDAYDLILDTGAVVIGISPDGVASHKKFKEKHDLPFHLLSDPYKEVSADYGAYGEKNMFGKKIMGIIRSTFIIDEHMKIVKVYRKVTVKGHIETLLQDINTLT